MQLLLQLAPFLLVMAGVVAGAYAFVGLKREIHQLGRRIKQQQDLFEALRGKLTADFADAQVRLRDAEERAGVLVAPSPPRSGLNLTKRSQALRMSRVGEKPEKIAAALSLPRKEVELLLKVQKIVLHSNELTS